MNNGFHKCFLRSLSSFFSLELDLTALLLSAIEELEEGLQAITQRWSERNLEEATTGEELTGPISSHLALTSDGSHRSQGSSDTLVEARREQYVNEQPRAFPSRFMEHIPSLEMELDLLATQTSSYFGNAPAEAHQPSHAERQGANHEQFYGATLYEMEMDEGEDFWKSVTHGHLLPENSLEDPNALSQQFLIPDGSR